MRALVIGTVVSLVVVAQASPSAQAADNPIVRKNNDAGASSTVIRKDEPPLTAMPPHHDRTPSNRHDQ